MRKSTAMLAAMAAVGGSSFHETLDRLEGKANNDMEAKKRALDFAKRQAELPPAKPIPKFKHRQQSKKRRRK